MTLTLTRTPWLCLLTWLAVCGVAQAQSMHPYRTAQAIQLSSQLLARSPYSGTKLKTPLTDWIQTMLVRDQIPIWLDRRIPSDHELDIEIPKDQTNRELLMLVAAHLDAQIAQVDRYIALVPKGTAESIEWAYWSLYNPPSHPSLRVSRKDSFEWTDASDTREIWKAFVERYRLTNLADSSRLVSDFDRWRAGRLDTTNPAAIATLLLCGFDQRLSWPEGQSPSIESLSEDYKQLASAPNGPSVRFQYSTEIPKIGKTAWQAWKSRWPDAKVERASSIDTSKTEAWEVLAPVASHRELVEPLAPIAKPKPINPESKKKFTGRYRGEILKILDNLSQQLGLQLTSKDLTTNLARQEVDVEFKDATLEEIIAKLGQASGLKITLEGKTLIVEAQER
ncbi:MAG: hypothetical protein ACKOAU_01810 [Pirellula sp.]